MAPKKKKGGATAASAGAGAPKPGSASSHGPIQILPHLYIGPRSSTVPAVALAHGITHIVSVGCHPDNSAPWDPAISYHRLSLLDSPDAEIGMVLDLAAEIIRNAKESGSGGGGDQQGAEAGNSTSSGSNSQTSGRVLVHCVAAISRSPAVIADYLVREEGMSLKAALALLVSKRENIKPNDGFLRQLKAREVEFRGEGSLEGVDSLPASTKAKKALLGAVDG